MFNYCFNDLWLSPPTLDLENSPDRECACHKTSHNIEMFFLCLRFQEYQSCNTLPCPDLKKTTPWTPWTPVNISDNGGHYEQRFRYTCKARIPDPSLLEVGRQRIEMRYCSSDGSTGCSTDGKCREKETDGVFPDISASGCLCVISLQLVSCVSAGLLLASSPRAIPPFCMSVVY